MLSPINVDGVMRGRRNDRILILLNILDNIGLEPTLAISFYYEPKV